MATADVRVPQYAAPHVPRLNTRKWSEVPSKPLAGRLPVKRVLPMELHAMMDYSGSGMLAGSAAMANSPEAKAVGLALAGAGAGVSLLTDYDLSVAKVIPIEVHEAIDYVWGASSVLAPFIFGYAKKDPVASAVQIFTGLATIIGSLFTDYRAAKGVTWRGWPQR